jgi:hypothetical protein
MSEPGRAVPIHGVTPAGAACEAMLGRAGTPVRLIDSGAMSDGLAVVSRGLIAELGLEKSMPSRPIECIIDRKLTEDDAFDTERSPESVALVRKADIVEALTRGIERATNVETDSRAFSIDAAEFRLGDPDLLDDSLLPLSKTLACIQLDWVGPATGRASWIRLTGEGLAEVDATTSILTSHDQTTLILVVPMASVVETSISVVDVLARILTHPSVKCELPDLEPRTASTRLIRTGEPVHFTLQGGVKVRVGAAAGSADPVVLDRELRSGMVVAEQVALAIADGRLSLARLSRIARVWSSLECAQAMSS